MLNFKLSLLLIWLITISLPIFSQKIFREGFIVKNNGEATEGLINFITGNSIPRSCTFKKFDIAVEISYTAYDLKAFAYRNGSRYESIEFENKKQFLQVLVSGELTLLKGGSRYYIRKSNQPLTEIKKGSVEWTDGYIQMEFANPEEFLKYIASGTDIEIKDKIDPEKDLIPFVSAYNRNSGKSYFVSKKDVDAGKYLRNPVYMNGDRIKYGVSAGLNIYSLSLEWDGNSFLPDPEQEMGLMFGFSIERIISRRSDKLSVKTDLLYLQQSFYAYSYKENFGRFIRDDAFFDFKAVKLPLTLQYNFPGMKVIPFLNGGVGTMLLIKKNYLHINETENTNQSIYTSEDSDMKFSNLELSAVLGGGVKVKIINNLLLNIQGRFEYGKGIFYRRKFDLMREHSVQPSVLIGIVF